MASRKVLLVAINAKYIHSNLAVYSLRANAGEYRDDVEICEYTINHRVEDIISRIYEKKPDCIGFSCYLWNIAYTMAVAKDLKKILPELTIVVGGPEVSYRPEEVLRENPFLDAVMVGEGERTYYEYLAWYLEGKGALKEIAGLVYREDDEITRTLAREGLIMDELIFPYEDLEEMENRIVYYESSRGCPFSCSYCLSSIEKSVRLKSLNKTLAELDFFIERKVPQVKFVDRTFNCNHEHAYEIWKYIGEHDNGVTNFHFEIAGDLLREEDFELVKDFRPGLVQFEIGVQSTNPDTITAIRRKMDIRKVAYNVEQVRKHRNIHQHLDLIAGLPHEDLESFKKSFNDVYAMKPDQLQLGFLKVLSGSYMNEAKEDYGIVFSSHPPYEVYATKWLSYEDVLLLKQVEEMVEVYYNSFQFLATITYLNRFFENSFSMYEKIGRYYKENHLFDVKHSRFARYEILWKFFETQSQIGKEEKEVLWETMIYDLYSREDVKKRLGFIPQGMYTKKEKIHCFTVDMEHLLETGELRKREPYHIRFDYENRDPLSYLAKGVEI